MLKPSLNLVYCPLYSNTVLVRRYECHTHDYDTDNLTYDSSYDERKDLPVKINE